MLAPCCPVQGARRSAGVCAVAALAVLSSLQARAAGSAPAQHLAPPAAKGDGRAALADCAGAPASRSRADAPPHGRHRGTPAYSTIELYSNGPYITAVGAGHSGADVSMIEPGFDVFGYAQTIQLQDTRIADDFTVPPGATWTLSRLRWLTYQTNAPTSGTITGIEVRVWDTLPVSGASPVYSGPANAMLSSQWTGVFRVEASIPTSPSRPILEVTADLSWLPPLTAGTYWVDVQCEGSLSNGPWAPPTVPHAASDHALQATGDGAVWFDLLDVPPPFGSGLPQDFPFALDGTFDATATVYCTALANSCAAPPPTIGAPASSTSASAASLNSFDIICGIVPGGVQSSLLIYTKNGPKNPPLLLGSGQGWLCIEGLTRIPAVISGNPITVPAPANCTGSYTYHFGNFLTFQTADPALFATAIPSGGISLDVQAWYRDAASPEGGRFSNALQFLVLP